MENESTGTLERALSRVLPTRRKVWELAAFAGKLAITGVCFWYLSRRIDFNALLHAPSALDPRSACLVVILLMTQIPLISLRWRNIVNALDGGRRSLPINPAIACTAIVTFFAQVVPNLAADSLRAWMLTRLDRGWRLAFASVAIDRVVGIAALFAVGLIVLQLPSPLTALGGYRTVVSEIFGVFLLTGVIGLTIAPRLAAFFELWRYTVWIGGLVRATQKIFLARFVGLGIIGIAFLVHAISIAAIWLVARAIGLHLSVLDAAVLFVVIVAVALIPVSIGGWGIRELTVSSLLAEYGVPLEQALFFSVSFGLALLVASLPGAVVWAVYSPSAEQASPALARQ